MRSIAAYVNWRIGGGVQFAPRIYTLPAHERGDCLKVPRTMEDTMRSFTTVVLPIILAAGISGLMFTATLA